MRRTTKIIGWLLSWVWTPLLARGALWTGAFLALAHVGSGAAVRALAPPGQGAHSGLGKSAPRAAVTQAVAAPPCASAAASSSPRAAPLDLNRATAQELDALPGVGAKRAAAIVALRERLGGFRHPRDLMRVRGIGYRSLQRLGPLVTVGPARPAASAADQAKP